MATATPETRTHTGHAKDQSVKSILNDLHGLFTQAAERQSEPAFFEEIGASLLRLHAQIRAQHTGNRFTLDASTSPSPELSEEVKRLEGEHPMILGKLDRLVRDVDSMADRTHEDKEVFFLRGLELIALVQRHEAEEDRIFFLSVWRETGGES